MGQSISVTVHNDDGRGHGTDTDSDDGWSRGPHDNDLDYYTKPGDDGDDDDGDGTNDPDNPDGTDDPDDQDDSDGTGGPGNSAITVYPDDPGDPDIPGKGKRTKKPGHHHGRPTKSGGGRPNGGRHTGKPGHTKEGLNNLPTNPGGGPFRKRTTLPDDLNGFTPPKSWPDYCKSKHGWCFHIIAEIIKMKCIPQKIVGPMTTPTVPPKKKKQIRKKCHQVPSCVNRELAKLRKTLMSEYLMERAGLGRKGTQKRTYMIAGLIGLLVLLILLIILYFCFCYGDKERKGGKKGKGTSAKGSRKGSVKAGVQPAGGAAPASGSVKNSTKKSCKYKSNRYKSNKPAGKKPTTKMKSTAGGSPTPKSKASNKKSKQSKSPHGKQIKTAQAKSSRGAQVAIKMPKPANKT